MNFKQGLIRLWIVGSIIWLVIVVVFYSRMPGDSANPSKWIEVVGVTFIPIVVAGLLMAGGFWVAKGFKSKDE